MGFTLVHLDARALQQAFHVEKAPAEQCYDHADDDEKERQRCTIGILAALEGAPVDVEGVDGRVVEWAALGKKKDIFEAHQERERLVDRHEADRPAQRRQGQAYGDCVGLVH